MSKCKNISVVAAKVAVFWQHFPATAGIQVAKSGPMRFVIVKKGALSTFRFLEQSCKDIAGLRVVWDRRLGPDRRSDANKLTSDRRMEDRRRQLPHSWTAADHVLAEGPEVQEAQEERQSV